MFNKFSSLAVEDNVSADNVTDCEQASLRAVASCDSAGETGSRLDYKPSLDSGGPSKPLNKPMVWVDLEMTGLDIDQCTILSIACVVTSGDLKRVMLGPEIHIHQSDEVLANMNEWSEKAHGESGLTEKCRQSTISMKDAESQVLEFVRRHCVQGRAPLTGNSVHVDKMFIRKYMPELDSFLHFRIIDVSTVNELSRRWVPGKLNFLQPKAKRHTAMSDILESLEELRCYQRHMFSYEHKGQPVVFQYYPCSPAEAVGK